MEMKTNCTHSVNHTFSMSKMAAIIVFFCISITLRISAQIYEPEGLNLPGAWNGWTNPPANNLALASSTQVAGGKVQKITDLSVPFWQTIIHAAASGGDVTPGTFAWLFTSGPSTNAFQNKWAAVNVIMDSLQQYTKEGSADNSVTLEDARFYTINWKDNGYANTQAIFMKTTAQPVEIDSVTVPSSVSAATPVQVQIILSGTPSAQEKIYLRYSVDGWNTSTALMSGQITGSTATVTIPGQPNGTVVTYYAFTSTRGNILADFDLYTIHFNNNEGANYSYTVGGGTPAISFANLQWPPTGTITPGAAYIVYSQVYIAGVTGQPTPAPGVQAWIGYNTADTDPSTWSNWISATFNGPSNSNDEYKTDLGTALTSIGTYYYASRFKYSSDPYVYGGYSASGGGYWNGTTNISGKVDVAVGLQDKEPALIKIYPNPASDFIKIIIPFAADIEILDVSGKQVQSHHLAAGTTRVDVESLQAGVYQIRFVSEQKTVHSTFIKY